jgi:uncharacterized protein YceK
MGFRAICGALLLSSLPIAGCGTVANLVDSRPVEGTRPFGGVSHDVFCLKEATNGESGFRAHPASEPEQYKQVALMLFCATDLPFSLIGDIVTWPYTAAYSCINQPVPVPPVTQAPTLLAAPAMAEGRAQTPLENLPEPKKQP